MFHLITIKQLLEVCLPYSRLLAGIPILAVFQNLIWNSNKTSLSHGRDSTKNPFHLSKQGQEPASSQEHE